MNHLNTSDFGHLFTHDIPLLDVRAPTEFSQGAFPSSINLPLMNDNERIAIGTCYKQHGQQHAIKLGHELINGEIKEQRISQWKQFCKENPSGYLNCFRGGLRSQITQQWLKEAGIDYPFVPGGYKTLRRFLINNIETFSLIPSTVISGNTGCGKTDLINELDNGIDIEGAARHRGSSFGRYVMSQRTQINFENELSIQMLKKHQTGYNNFVYEDEGKTVGSASLPLSVHRLIQKSNLVVIEDALEIRLHRLINEYIIKMKRDFVEQFGEEQGWIQFADYLGKGLFNIRKRLGNERHNKLLQAQQNAIQIMQKSGVVDHHTEWLVPLLKEYYDPMYQYQLSKKAERIVYRGDYHQVKQWLMAL